MDKVQILAGAVPAALLALAADGALGWIEKRWVSLRRRSRLADARAAGRGLFARARVSRVGSKNFSEQLVLGEIVAQHLENRLHGHVSRRLDLGGTLLAQQAMVSGDIDVYPEYTGTALTGGAEAGAAGRSGQGAGAGAARAMRSGIWSGSIRWALRTRSRWRSGKKMRRGAR